MGLKGNLAGALSMALKEWAREQRATMTGTPHEGEMETVLAKAYELAGTDTCFVKAGNSEPIFVLRAKDKLAATIVEDWAIEADRAGVNRDKVAGATKQAEAFRDWRLKHGAKVPD